MEEEEFDWILESDDQNPTVQSSSTVNGHQQPPLTTTAAGSSMQHVNGNGEFLAHNGGFSLQNRQQQQLQAIGTSNHVRSVNPIRSIFEYGDRHPADFNPYDYYYCHSDSLFSYGDFHPGLDHQSQSSLNGFPQPTYDRKLEIDFGRLHISSPNHHPLPFVPPPPPLPGSNSRNYSLFDSSFDIGNVYPHGRVVPAPVGFNRNMDFHDHHYNLQSSRRECFEWNQRGFSTLIDQNPILSRYRVSEYVNPNRNNHVLQSRQLPKRPKIPKSLEEGTPEDIEMIFNETKDRIHELMVDESANYLAQKLFKVCNERQMTHIVYSLITDHCSLTSICVNPHGTRAMQKLIELVTTAEQRSLIVSALERITLTLSKNTHGQHVIQYCVKSFHVDEVQPILDVVADNSMDIATDKSGCCVLQQCVFHAKGICKERLVTDIIANSLHLSRNQYGNYVVQHLIGMKIPVATYDIIQNLSGNFMSLSMDKHGSNVVEKCLKDGADHQSIHIILELINSQDFLTVIQDRYGNYVAQTVLKVAKGNLKVMMINKVEEEYAFIHSHPYGKKVLALAQSSKPRGSGHE